jgi:hypothetical protein
MDESGWQAFHNTDAESMLRGQHNTSTENPDFSQLLGDSKARGDVESLLLQGVNDQSIISTQQAPVLDPSQPPIIPAHRKVVPEDNLSDRYS